MHTIKKVFVSSVSQGMELYRDTVCRAIDSLDGYQCVRMESFGARNADVDEVCRNLVRGADTFVAILGHQYGSIHVPSGKSYSEREYDEAVQAGIEILVFIAPTDFPVMAHLIEADQKRQAQQAFRERAKNEKTVDSFTSAHDLATKVTQAIHNSEAQIRNIEFRGAPDLHTPGDPEPHASVTWLLFSYLQNTGGFDSSVAITNVSLDPLGTKPKSGRVILHFYGVNAPAASQTTEVHAGTPYSFVLSGVVPGFVGYMIAECHFAPARGLALLSDLGTRSFATCYLAEVLRVQE